MVLTLHSWTFLIPRVPVLLLSELMAWNHVTEGGGGGGGVCLYYMVNTLSEHE